LTQFEEARRLLRDPEARQAGFMAEKIRNLQMKKPILFLSGDEHRRRRKETARFFSPGLVEGRYRELMVTESTRLICDFQAKGRVNLDDVTLDLAVSVASEIVGLTGSPRHELARDLDALVSMDAATGNPFVRFLKLVRSQLILRRFYVRHVTPAVNARISTPHEDLISHLVKQGYSKIEIMTECLTYGAAGMLTTREFITMAAWHLFENNELRESFLTGNDEDRVRICEEILRVEPVLGLLYRRAGDSDRPVGVRVHAANTDESVIGVDACCIRADRRIPSRIGASGMSFGDGEHRCPGAQVAMNESAIFLNALFHVPGIRLEANPTPRWNRFLTSYELRGAVMTCGTAQDNRPCPT
jgi:cytochrome P450